MSFIQISNYSKSRGKIHTNYFALLFLLSLFMPSLLQAKSTERKVPESFKGVAYGGRFADRFLPMPVHKGLETDTWGAENVIPRDIHSGIEAAEWSYWGGNVLKGNDGKFHQFLCRWNEDHPRGHMAWRGSHVVHAVGDKPGGPFTVKGEKIGGGHNPEAFRLADGRYVIYVIGAYYLSDTINGPWKRAKFSFDSRGRKKSAGLSNLTFARREDGSFLMVCRGGYCWVSQDGLKTYYKISQNRVYPSYPGNYEDPVVWKTGVQYHLVVNDWRGRRAYHLRSKDGINWKLDPGEAYSIGMAVYTDGTKVDWYKYERPKVCQDRYGRATHMHFAVIDVAKRKDKSDDNHSSKNIGIPLTVGRRLQLLNRDKIDAETKTIRVKVLAEDGFDPHEDMDMSSLRFGAPEEIDYGRGCKLTKTEADGKDLVLTFDAAGHGFNDHNFVGKLLGKTSKGKLLFGYASLPWLSKLDEILSPDQIKLTKTASEITVASRIRNLGQIKAKGSCLVVCKPKGGGAAIEKQVSLPSIAPYSTHEINVKLPMSLFAENSSYDISLTVKSRNHHPETLTHSM